ncbi:purine-nucleoside phosphorylase [Geopsychrobacter electrodiphilus]|uniref:purine-nucleoside phosphorylase n=1 Tax=Geopsychrobacter electrodiphilus TaxID=225196 RepID=UPI000380E37E|nr:purine-nucleoside phosphorylase [Geopsychrobacter electrodiphilus]
MIELSAMERTLDLIQRRTHGFSPVIAIILGSGMGPLQQKMQHARVIPYAELPLLPRQTVSGHQAELLLGELFGRKVALFCGRFHVYQGLTAFESTLTVQLAAALGCHAVVLTCAVGGIGDEVFPGDFLLIRDHLNFSGLNPLQGGQPPAFVDLHDCYRYDFAQCLTAEAVKLKRSLSTGILAYMPGPSYETPAEINALRILGASAVGMSTVPEAIMARALRLEVAALALVTNRAGGSPSEKLFHQEVLACSADAAEPFASLVNSLLSLF